MAQLLKGAPVAAVISAKTAEFAEKAKTLGVIPRLGILRVGARPDDVYYENALKKKCAQLGIAVKVTALEESVSQSELEAAFSALNDDETVHGILVFRPLPAHLDDAPIRGMLRPEKDVDGITDMSLAGVFTGSGAGYPPCTAQAVVEILDHYGIDVRGKRAAVIGRSLVVGRPAAMLLMRKDATVTICHTKTKDAAAISRSCDIVVASAGRAKTLGKGYFAAGQTVIDVGINEDTDGRMCGDVDFDAAVDIVGAITPVPGGVGAVTTAILLNHTADSALKYAESTGGGEA